MLTDEQRALADSFNIPVDSTHPQFSWVVCLDGMGQLPAEPEPDLHRVRSYIEFVLTVGHYEWPDAVIPARVYQQHRSDEEKAWLARLGCIPGHNTTCLSYSEVDGWRHGRSTWRSGPSLVPSRYLTEYYGREFEPLTLEQLIDQFCEHHTVFDPDVPDGPPHHGQSPSRRPAWLIWKAERPDLWSTPAACPDCGLPRGDLHICPHYKCPGRPQREK